MAEGRSQSLWQHTSALLSMVHNVNVDAKDRKSPSQFDPHQPRPAVSVVRDSEHAWAVMRAAFAPASLKD